MSGRPIHVVGSVLPAQRRGEGTVALTAAGLVVQAVEDRGSLFLEAHGLSDPTRSLVLTLTHRPVVEGISSFTPLGRLHARCWGLAFGVGALPTGARVRFGSDTLRHATSALCAVHRLAHECWVADAEGVFRSAVLLVDGEELARTRLAPGP